MQPNYPKAVNVHANVHVHEHVNVDEIRNSEALKARRSKERVNVDEIRDSEALKARCRLAQGGGRAAPGTLG